MKPIKTPVRYCYEDWMIFDADDQWVASFDAGEVGPQVALILNFYPDLLAACVAAIEYLTDKAADQDLDPDGIEAELALLLVRLETETAKAKGDQC